MSTAALDIEALHRIKDQRLRDNTPLPAIGNAPLVGALAARTATQAITPHTTNQARNRRANNLDRRRKL